MAPGPMPGPLAALRAQMGLPPAAPSPAASGALNDGGPGAPGAHLAGLVRLGQQLLGSSGAADSAESAAGLGPEVLVSAARERLMAADPGSLTMAQVGLLAADYAGLAGADAERALLARCAGAAAAVPAPRASASFALCMLRDPVSRQLGSVWTPRAGGCFLRLQDGHVLPFIRHPQSRRNRGVLCSNLCRIEPGAEDNAAIPEWPSNATLMAAQSGALRLADLASLQHQYAALLSAGAA